MPALNIYFKFLACLAVSCLSLLSLKASEWPAPNAMLTQIKSQAKNLIEAEGTFTGEVTAWQANYEADRFVRAYKETADLEYLQAAREYFDALLAKLHTSPDGYRGWVGPYVYDNQYSTDVPVADAILTLHMLEFAEVVQTLPSDVPELSEAAERYTAFARKDVIEKWDARGTWHEDGPYGYYKTWPRMFVGQDLSKRVETHTQHDRLTYQFNKQTEMALVALRLYRLTGEEAMRDKATRIARLIKSRLTLHDGHYSWSYWEPLAPSDLWSAEEGKLSHWVGTHPHRHYQIIELKFYVEAFHTGIVFDAEDMRRFTRTHDAVMWNGDFENPVWHNSDAGVIEAVTGSYTAPEPRPGLESFYKGRPWGPLADFSDNIRRLTGATCEPEQASFQRKTDHPVESAPYIGLSTPHFKMAAAIPAAVPQGDTLHAVASARVGGRHSLELYTADGLQKIKTLFEGHFQKTGNSIQAVDTTQLEPGSYRLRWSMQGEARDAIFWVKSPVILDGQLSAPE